MINEKKSSTSHWWRKRYDVGCNRVHWKAFLEGNLEKHISSDFFLKTYCIKITVGNTKN